MEFKNIFDLNDFLFKYPLAWNENSNVYGPIHGYLLNYDSNNFFQYDIFYINSKMSGDKNLYEEFINQYFFSPLRSILDSESMSKSQIPVINIYEDYNGKKHIIFDLNVYCSAVLNSISLTDIPKSALSYNTDFDQKIETLRDALREERKRLNDVLINKEKSIYYNKMLEVYNETTSKFGGTVNEIFITMNNLIESKISFCTKMIIGCRYLKDFFQKEIDTDKLIPCFDYDKLCLIFAECFFRNLVSDDGKITGAANYLLNYFKAYDKYMEINPKYNPRIKFFDGNKMQIISASELKEKFLKTLDAHPEFNYWTVEPEEIESYCLKLLDDSETIPELTIKEFTSLIRMLHQKNNYKETSSNDIKSDIEELNEIERHTTDENVRNKVKQQKDKIEFLLNNNPVKIIRGIGTFSNYYGYVYQNGYVVFDVLEKDFNKSYGNALFIMPYNKVTSFSDMKKRELRKNELDFVTTIIHRGNWKNRILEKLSEATPEKIDMDGLDSINISEITSLEELEKLKIKLSTLTDQEKDLIEKRKRKIIIMKNIDEELKNNSDSDSLSYDDFNFEITEILETGITDFDELYNYWKQKNNFKNVKRNPSVAAITKLRARDSEGNFSCELCGVRGFDSQSFDSHHMIPLGSGGIDNVYNTVCLCPNCHRNIHSGKVTLSQQFELFEKIKRHLLKDNPEYIDNFEQMISPITESEDYYYAHKDIEDKKFAIFWNGDSTKSR